MIPAITTGMRDWLRQFPASVQKQISSAALGSMRTFMMRSGRYMPIPAIPMPDFDVPYAAPAPDRRHECHSSP